MTRADRALVTFLVAGLAVVAIGIAQAPVADAPVPSGTPPVTSASPATADSGPTVYREGLLGGVTSVTPLTARTTADRELVSLVFAGLVRLGAGGALEPDLATSWTVDSTGAKWTFELRSDAAWQDGQPVTSADVVYTVKALQNPAYDGPDAASWREVTVVAVDDRHVRFTLATPLGGFLQEMTQPLLPDHLLRDVPIDALADGSFAHEPIGAGAFRLVTLSDTEADLVPWPAGAIAESAGASPGASGTLSSGASPAPSSGASVAAGSGASAAPSLGEPIERIALRFYADPAALVAAYDAGDIDAAVGLSAADAVRLSGTAGTRLLRYPLTTLTAIVVNQRARQPFRDLALRKALLQTVDRNALIEHVVSGLGARADTPIPNASWAFDASASTALAFDRAGAAAALKKAGWKKATGGWSQPNAKGPLTLKVIAVDADSNPIVAAAAAETVRAWTTFGFRVAFESLPPARLATRLQSGSFGLAIVDVNLGLDPDLYPLFASTQATSKGTNVAGIQNHELDGLLAQARAPGSSAARRKAYRNLQALLSDIQLMPTLFYRDEPVVLSNRVLGPTPNLLGGPGDRFWDVLTWRLASSR